MSQLDSRTRSDIAVIGGGQLARMMQAPALALGIRIRLLAEAPDASAAQVIADQIVGDYTDLGDLTAVAHGVEVITFDHEHVPGEHLRELMRHGHACRPGPDALQFAQDKAKMRQRLRELDIAMPRYAYITTRTELENFAAQVGGFPVIVKTARGGYDGKGVWNVSASDEISDLFALVESGEHAVLLAEERIDFRRELAVLVARRPSGELRSYPPVESVQVDGICTDVIAPAPDLADDIAEHGEQLACTIAAELDVTGVMAVELFQTHDDRLLVNELAMRPHNTGHWTIDGSVTSQFENHLRAVLDEPLGPTAATAPVSVMVNILGGQVTDLARQRAHALAAEPNVHIHLYGKQVRPGRKVGHVTACGHDLQLVRRSAQRAAAMMQDGAEADEGFAGPTVGSTS